jgi:HPt (histidine-containing phosphotransfer) domain-containing protein
MNDYVSKPVSPQALAEALDKWLPKEEDVDGSMKAEERMRMGEILHDSALSAQRSAPSTQHSALIFDRAGLMARLMDDQDLARIVIEGFLEDVPRQIEALRGYLEAGDAPGAERQAHTVKGASANVGGECLREVAFEMEKAGKAGDLAAIKARMAGLETEFDRLKIAMKKEI